MTSTAPSQHVSLAAGTRMPDFLIIGAAKSGTTTLHQLLGKHPRVFVSHPKEPEFFAVDAVFERGLSWYQALFQNARADQLCGEASTAYTRFPQLPLASERIARMLPEVKLIYVMRHPIDRAYSHYVHRVTRELYPHQPIRWTFEEHVARDPMCLDGSRYMEQIDRYLRFYPKESFLFLLTEELNKQPVEAVRKAWRFLRLDEVAIESADTRSNESEGIRDGRIRRYTMSPLRNVPLLRNLKDVIPNVAKDWFYSVLHRSPYGKWVARRHTPPRMMAETRAKLIEEFRPHNRRLGEFLDRDLSHWDR